MTTELEFGATGGPHTTPPTSPPARSAAMRAYCATLARFTSAVQSTEQLLRNDDAGTREDAEQREQTAATRLRGIDRAGAAATDGLAHCTAVRTEHGLPFADRSPAGHPSAPACDVNDTWSERPVPGDRLDSGPASPGTSGDTLAARPGGDRPNWTGTNSPYHHLEPAPDDTGPGEGAAHGPVGAQPGLSTDHVGSVAATPYGRPGPLPGDGPNARSVSGRGHGPSDHTLHPGSTADPGLAHRSTASITVHAEPTTLPRRPSTVTDDATPVDAAPVAAPGIDRLRRTGGADLGVALSALGRRRDELKLAESDFATWLEAHDERSRHVALGAVIAAAATAAIVMAVVGTRMAAPAALALLIVCTLAVIAVGLGVAAARRLPRVCQGAGLARRPDPARLARYGARVGGAALLALTAVNIGAGVL